MTNVLSPEEGSVSAHSRFDLESSGITNWVWWVFEWNLWLDIDSPSLVGTVVALVPDEVGVVSISSTLNVEADSLGSNSSQSVVLDGSSGSGPVKSLPELVGVWSSNSLDVVSSSLTLLDGDGVSSVDNRSDGLSSEVEGPPLSSVGVDIVSDSESVLSSSDVLVGPDDWSS